MDSLVTTQWLAAQRDVRIVDATLLAGELARDAAAEYRGGHIPGAVFLDLANLRDTGSPLPNMLPDAARMARLGARGIGDGVRIVLYDDSPWRTAARAWWMLRTYGLRDVAILDGGLAKWRREGRPLATGDETVPPVSFAPAANADAVRSGAQMRANLDTAVEQVVDARSAPRFTGNEPDPHKGTAPGHIPGSRSLPYTQLFAGDGTWLRGAALAAAFATAGVDPARPLIATCGSGVTAAILAFGAHLLGHDVAIYDGSWSQWGADPATPKALGPA